MIPTPTLPAAPVGPAKTEFSLKPGVRPYANRYVKNGYRYDVRATATMVEELLFNPVLAAKVLLDIEVPPHQELRLLMMWTHSMTLDDSGFSTGKTHTAAMVISLRSVLMRNRISGVISKTMRQGKFIFSKIDGWANANKIFRNTIKTYNGKLRIVSDPAVHQIYWKGGSILRVLPPNFLNDAEGLKGERWNDGYCDEWNSYGNEHAMTSTIFGRVTEANDFEDCPVRQNHLHLFATPRFKHHSSYRLVENIDKDIAAGNTDYAHFTCNYRHIPRTKKWKKLVDRKRIRLMQINNPPGTNTTEIDGLWETDSKTYYSSLYIEEAAKLWNPDKHLVLTKRYAEGDVYLCAFDMARGSLDRRKLKGDDFGFVVLRIPYGFTEAYPCFAFRKNGAKASEAAAMLHKYHAAFGFSYLAYDPQGGGMFVYDELVKNRHRWDDQDHSVAPLVDWEDKTGLIGDRIVVPLRRSTDLVKVIWEGMTSDNVFLNRMHNLMKQSLESFSLPMLPRPPLMEKFMLDDVEEIRQFLHKDGHSLSEYDRATCELFLMSRQLINVDVKRDLTTGEEIRDAKQMLLFTSKEKKDLAYCLVYARMLYEIYTRMKEMGLVVDHNPRSQGMVYGSFQPL